MAYEGTEVDFKTGKVRATVMTPGQIAAAVWRTGLCGVLGGKG